MNLDQSEIQIIDVDDESDADEEDEESKREKEEYDNRESGYFALTTIFLVKSTNFYLQEHPNVWIAPGSETITPPPENTMC